MSLFAKKDGDLVDNTDKIAALLVRAKERKQREEQTAALRIENMDRRDYDDDDEGPRRSGGGGGAKGADSAGSSATSKKRTANAADMGVDFGGDEDAAAGDMEEDDFFM